MGKTIGINNVPEYVKEELIAKGYNVTENTADEYLDTILYDSSEGSISYLNVFDNVIDMDSGAFIVDVRNKNIDEIINTIENRRYTSLF